MLKGIVAKMISSGSTILLFYSVCVVLFLCHSMLANASAAGTTPYVFDVYKHAENNIIASSICKAIDMGITLMIPLFAIMFCIIGLQIFQGQVKWTIFLTFFVGMAAFKGAGSILEFFMPHLGLEFGCKCATYRYVRDAEGIIRAQATGLDEKCRDVTSATELITEVPTGTVSITPATATTPAFATLTVP